MPQPQDAVALLTCVFIVTFPTGGSTQEPPPAEYPTAVFEALRPLHRLKEPPGPYDWLATQPEPGQTFTQFKDSSPARPGPGNRNIDIVLLGDFDGPRRRVIEQTARFIEAFYQMPVRIAGEIPLSAVPAAARRVHPVTGDAQILSTYVIDEVLVPRRRPDAFTTIAFTASDLWPGEGWNFVFGQASLDDRVGVWSIYRNGDPGAGEEEARICLLRTIKTGTHELGHMFGLYHCIFFECGMNGSNHRQETDRRPVWFCPVDLRKLAWALGWDLTRRFRDLEGVSRDLGFDEMADFYRRSTEAAGGAGGAPREEAEEALSR